MNEAQLKQERYEDAVVEGIVSALNQQRDRLNTGPNIPLIDVKYLRIKLRLSQLDFAERYGIPLATLQGWEQGSSKPDTFANIMLHFISDEPVITAAKIENMQR